VVNIDASVHAPDAFHFARHAPANRSARVGPTNETPLRRPISDG
jgi:hypothetical protein